MRRIFIDKEEIVAEVIEKIIDSPEAELMLVVPKNSVLKESVGNFHLIKREADAAKKKILLESVDEEVLALAIASQLEAIHPLFNGQDLRSLSDIVVPRSQSDKEDDRSRVKEKKEKKALKLAREISSETDQIFSKEEIQPRKKRYFKTVLIWPAVILILVFGGVLVFGRFFGRAVIAINLEKKPWAYKNNFLADKSLVKISVGNNSLPAELFTLQKNMVQLFPASGSKNVSQKATGRITVYNAYSSQPQTLVATTRFVTPDGKIFRLIDQLLIPGATVKDGKIIPSSVEADVTADKAGSDYNVGPVSHLSIPGFKGTPKYDGFYGALLSGTKGGFAGMKAVPTTQDTATAKVKATEVLTNALKNNFSASAPDGFKILASDVKVTKLTVNETTDDKGNFSVFGEAIFRATGFREEDLISLLLSLASAGKKLVFDDLKIDYSQIKPDFERGKLNFYVTAQGDLKAFFDEDGFKNSILGKDADTVRMSVLGLEGLANARVSLWPFWINNVPSSGSRVTVSVN